MKKSIIVIALIIPLMLNAQDFGRRHDKFSQHRENYEMAFQDLDLTDAQREEIFDLKTAFKKANIQREADLKVAYIELHELMRNEETGKNLDSAIDKVNQLKSEIFKARIKNRLEVQKVLTEEQKDKLKAMGGKRMHRQGLDCMGFGHDDCDRHNRRNFGKQRSF